MHVYTPWSGSSLTKLALPLNWGITGLETPTFGTNETAEAGIKTPIRHQHSSNKMFNTKSTVLMKFTLLQRCHQFIRSLCMSYSYSVFVTASSISFLFVWQHLPIGKMPPRKAVPPFHSVIQFSYWFVNSHQGLYSG